MIIMIAKISPNLDLSVRQRLVLTPQLRQAIRILQLPLAELQQEVEEVVMANPMLELVEEESESFNRAEAMEEPDPLEPLDFSWQDLYDSLIPTVSEEEAQIQYREPENLKKYLLWQLEITTTDETELEAGYILIDALNEGGLLTADLAEIRHAFPEISPEVWDRILKKIQSFDPPGVGARSVQEALELQLQQFPETPARNLAFSLLHLGLEEIRRLGFNKLRARLSCHPELLQEALSLLRRLNPRPGSAIGEVSTAYIIPDVVVKWRNNRFEVEINEDALPKLRIHPFYAKVVTDRHDRDTRPLRALLQEAKWFLKSLHSRRETLHQVACAIVKRQQEFFRHGEEALKPLTLKEIAREVELHESTVSRAIHHKYMATLRGIFPFKFFFASRLSAAEGEASSTAIKAKIKALIEQEDPQKPLSDAKITLLLRKEGIDIARRTVAKYREALGIPSSSIRRRKF